VRLAPQGVGGRLTLAECYEGAGKLASAWTQYTLAQAAAARQKQTAREKKAAQRASALRPKLAELTVTVPEAVRATEGLLVERDGVAIGAAQWDTAIPVDKGAHEVVATAPGKQRWAKTADVAADGEKATVTLEPLIDEPKPEASAEAPPAPPPTPPPKAEPPPRSEGLGTQRIAAVVAGGVGVVAIGVGAFFGIRAMSKQSESEETHCRVEPSTTCDAEGLAIRDDGRTAGTISTVFFVVGAVGAGAGVTLWLTAPKDGQPGTRTALRATPGGLVLAGSYR
jgi:hypothetical protein